MFRGRALRLAGLTVLVMWIMSETSTPCAQGLTPTRVSGNLVFWDQARGFETVMTHADLFTEISPFWYRVAADGQVVAYTTGAGATYEDPSIISFLKGNGILVMPTVANVLGGVWDGPLVSRILRDSGLAAANIQAIVRLAVTKNYDGIDLDYEDLPGSDRAAFSAFVTRLADALHAERKLLSVNVYAKTSEPGTWDGPRAQDWAAIGAAADQVRIMAYEYHWSGSEPGPIGPIDWVRDVLAFARTVVPPEKIVHGIPLYGYDWGSAGAVDYVWDDSMRVAAEHGADIQWDGASASPWFEYTSGRTRHAVWFENAASTDAKLGAAQACEVTGVGFWRLGGEDPSTWTALRRRLGAAPRDTTPPSVAILAPRDGAAVVRKQKIEVSVADNVGVVRVEVFVNDVLLGTDTAAPYVLWWNTNRLARGTYVVRAVAHDAAGNAASAAVTVSR